LEATRTLQIWETLKLFFLPLAASEGESASDSVTRRLEKYSPKFLKKEPKQLPKVQNIYIKPHLKPKNTCNKPYFKTTYFGENIKDLLKQKVAQNVYISLGYFYFFYSKNRNWHTEVAQLVKNRPIWSPWRRRKGTASASEENV
jgi:hypothetical protein